MIDAYPRPFGPYVLVKPLARGGMGALYLAVHGVRGMEKLCVVKTALPHLADRSYLQRFRDEAKVVVRLSHGNLVTVFDAGQVKGEIYLAMDFVEGKDLRAVWNKCAQKGIAFPVPVAVHIVKELVRGLGYAHGFDKLSLVHRDVSPPNVLLSYSGEVKLTDFGLATSTLKMEKTAPGVIYGKVSYMAPEQARGEPLDGRADIYAAGVILWELLTGRQLFAASNKPGGSDEDLLERVRQGAVTPPSKRASRVPVELDAICMKALAMDRKSRYATGEEMRSDLAAFLARTAPATDGAQVARFLQDLFGDSIGKERTERAQLAATAAAMLETKLSNVSAPAFVPPSKKLDEPITSPMPATDDPSLSNEFDSRDRTEAISKPNDEVSRLVGTVLGGRYAIRRLCGEGGMGRVYEAEHIEIGKRVAVKVLHPAYTRTPEVVERFRREARAASKMQHPNIVNVTDSGTTSDGSFFFVMEYIEGIELGLAIHRDGPLPVERMLKISEQMCEALQAAHDAGVIHRDLKPENILLVAPPRAGKNTPGPLPHATGERAPDYVKVLDFGIAKSAEVEESAKNGKRLTRPGVAMGTPEYMAPEQAAGKPADPRSDIYAVGSIMYEMLTGSPPYDGDNVMEVLHKKANEAPQPLREVRPDVPPAVATLIERAMARSPDGRPQSMGELAREIRGLAAVATTAVHIPTGPAPRRMSPVAAGALDPAAAFAALGLSRRGLAIGGAVLALLGTFVIVRAATATRTPPASASQVAPAPIPPPAPAVPAVDQDVVAAIPDPADLVEPAAEEPPPAVEDGTRRPPRGGRGPGAPAPGLNHKKMLDEANTRAQAQQLVEARAIYTKLLPVKTMRGKALVGLADVAFQEKNYMDAAKLAGDAVKARGGVRAFVLLGDAHYRMKNFDQAEKAYAEALKLDPTHKGASTGLRAVERSRH